MASESYPTFIPPRPTIYNGTPMRSRLEAHFARWFDGWRGVEWQYEPCAFGSQLSQYLPDFVVDGFRCSWLDGPQRVYFEVKPSIFGWQHKWDSEIGAISSYQESAFLAEEALYRNMATIWSSDPNAVLAVAKQREEGGADFVVLTPDPGSGDFMPWSEPVGLGMADFNGFVPMLSPLGAGAAPPPWPSGYWRVGR